MNLVLKYNRYLTGLEKSEHTKSFEKGYIVSVRLCNKMGRRHLPLRQSIAASAAGSGESGPSAAIVVVEYVDGCSAHILLKLWLPSM